MQRKSIVIVSVIVAAIGFTAQMGCGPNCAKLITAKSPEDLNYEDAVRINDFVKRRKAAMKEAEGGNMYAVEEAKRTVTSCEFAIQMMVQTKNMYEIGSPQYEKNLTEINDTRCFFDEVLMSKGKLVGKGKESFLSASTCNDIRARYEKYNGLFGDEGTLSERAINDVYKKGVKAKKKGAPGKDGEVAEEEEGGGVPAEDDGSEGAGDDAAGDDAAGDDAAGDDGETQPAAGGMDAF
jgi:hypothetical protein